jgi:outer membrane protein assembly factor BamE (lipoprotein component of BamABCDE complex)
MNPMLSVAVAGCAIVLLLPGCTRITNKQGYIFDPDLVASVQPGVDNKESVTKTLGRPTAVAEWDDNSWYYVSRTTRQVAYLRPRASEQTVLIVRFRPDGAVSTVEKRGLEKAVDITPNGDKTPTLGRDSGLLNDLFGNIGQVSPGGAAGGTQ